jgi:hypothetical protein
MREVLAEPAAIIFQTQRQPVPPLNHEQLKVAAGENVRPHRSNFDTLIGPGFETYGSIREKSKNNFACI